MAKSLDKTGHPGCLRGRVVALGVTARLYLLPSVLLGGYILVMRSLTAFLPILLDHLGLVQAHIAALMAVFPAVRLAMTLPFGLAADILSPKRTAVLGLAVFSLSLLAMWGARGFGALLPLLLLAAAGGALFQVTCQALYFKSLGQKGRGKKVAFLSSVISLSYGLGPLAAGFLFESAGPEALFPFCFLLSLPFLLLSTALKDVMPAGLSLSEYKSDFLRKEVLVFVAVVFLYGTHIGVENVCLSLFLKHNIGVSEEAIGLAFFVICAFLSGMSLIAGPIADLYRNPLAFLCLGLLLSGLFNIAMLWVGSFGVFLGVRFLHVVGDALTMVARGLIVASLFPKERMGGNLGFTLFVFPAGMFVGSAMSGLFRGYILPFVAAGLLEIAAFVAILLVRPKFSPFFRRPLRRDKEQAEDRRPRKKRQSQQGH
ncbi:MAG TPA: MFS transporter [Armatimonadetes bacterium]|nr:MFS transporter [Armatimonadota bacterium]